jgi:urease accessory protein
VDNPCSNLSLSRLLQLASPMLPVGAYSYSQGLEWAIESGDVKDLNSAMVWIGDVLNSYQRSFELPILHRLYQAWQHQNMDEVSAWNDFYLAGRDTSEALAEMHQMGYSLCRLLNDLQSLPADFLQKLNHLNQPAFPTVYAAIAQYWEISARDMLHGYSWGWLENQVSAAMKTVPLGQVAGQKILLALGASLPQVVADALTLPEEKISNFNPLLSIAGCLHETQYTRLFRS